MLKALASKRQNITTKFQTELLLIKTDYLRQQIMRYFKNFVYMFAKRDV